MRDSVMVMSVASRLSREWRGDDAVRCRRIVGGFVNPATIKGDVVRMLRERNAAALNASPTKLVPSNHIAADVRQLNADQFVVMSVCFASSVGDEELATSLAIADAWAGVMRVPASAGRTGWKCGRLCSPQLCHCRDLCNAG